MPLGAHLRENSSPVAGVCQGLIGTHTEGHQLQQLWQLDGYVKNVQMDIVTKGKDKC